MFNNLKLAIQTFKKNIGDYLAVSFVFGVILFVGVLLSEFLLGPIVSFVVVAIPAIISLKFCAFHSHDKDLVEFKNMKIGFLTWFKSIKIYFIVILKAFFVAFFIGVVVFSFFYSSAIEIASKTIPGLYDNLLNIDTVEYTYKAMFEIEKVKNLLIIGSVVSLFVGYLIYFSLKLKRDFIPFIAFEMPINSKRAIATNQKMIQGNYLKMFISHMVIVLMFVVPVGLAYLTKLALESNEVLSAETVMIVSSIVFCVLAGPIALIKQLHYVYSYKLYSKPFKEDFDNELKSIIKEIEDLQKKIDKND